MMMSLAIIYLLKNFYSNEMVNEALNIYTKDNQKAKYENYTNNPT